MTHRPTLDYNTVVLADGGAPACLALAPLSVVLADGGAPALVPELHVVADGGAPAAPSLRSMQCKSSSAGSSFFTEEHDVMPQISCMSRKPTMYLAASITSLSLGTAPVLDGFSSRSEPAFNQTHRAGAFGGDQHVYTQSVCHCSWPLGRLAHAQMRAAQPLVVLESSALIRPSVGFVY